MYRRVIAGVSFMALFFATAALAQTQMSTNEAVMQKFTQVEQHYQLPSGVMAKIARIESGGNVNARAQTSSAAGLFQWLTGSWHTTTRQLYGSPRHPNERFNPYTASEVTGYNLRQIQNNVWPIAQRAGADQQTALYMGHFLGMAGAGKFFNIMASPQGRNASAATYYPEAARANGSVFRGRTIAGVYNYFAAKMQQPGITGVSNYTNTYDGPTAGRIMDTAGSLALAQPYTGAPPTGQGTSYDYPTTFNQQQDNAVMNNIQPPSGSAAQTTSNTSSGSTGNVSPGANPAAFSPAGILITQQTSVTRGYPIVIAWATVGMQSCVVYANDSYLVEGHNGHMAVGSNLVPVEGGILKFTMTCYAYSGAVTGSSASVTVYPSPAFGGQNSPLPSPPPVILPPSGGSFVE